MSVATEAVKLAWALAREAWKFSRKRAPGQEDHYFPAAPDVLNLREGECFYCHGVFAQPYPKRGCKGHP